MQSSRCVSVLIYSWIMVKQTNAVNDPTCSIVPWHLLCRFQSDSLACQVDNASMTVSHSQAAVREPATTSPAESRSNRREYLPRQMTWMMPNDDDHVDMPEWIVDGKSPLAILSEFCSKVRLANLRWTLSSKPFPPSTGSSRAKGTSHHSSRLTYRAGNVLWCGARGDDSARPCQPIHGVRSR